MSLKLNGKHFFLYVDSDFRCVVYTFHSLHSSHADGAGDGAGVYHIAYK